MLGAKYAMGAVTLMASMGKRDDKSTVSVGTSAAGADKKITGLGVDYALGKRTNLWARYENRDGDTTRSGVSTLNSKASWDATKTTAVGIRATF
jgi:predicted porin